MHSAKTPVIDAHHHLWRYSREEYGWIDEPMAAIRRDFLPKSICYPSWQTAGIDGTISIQATQSLEETYWLLDLARNCEASRGVVGWASIASPDFEDSVHANLAAEPKLVGLRHVVQAEPQGFLEGAEFNRGIRAMRDNGIDS